MPDKIWPERASVQCLKCEDEIQSQSHHDFHYCTCGAVAVDGGREYLRILGNHGDFEILPPKNNG